VPERPVARDQPRADGRGILGTGTPGPASPRPRRRPGFEHRLTFWPDSDEPLLLVSVHAGAEAGSPLTQMAEIDATYCRRLGFASWGEDMLEIPNVDSLTVALGDTAMELRVGGHPWLFSDQVEPGSASAWLAAFNGCCLMGLVLPDPSGDPTPTFARFLTGLSSGAALIGQVEVVAGP